MPTIFCQACGARNPEEREYCLRCHHKLFVISGPLEEMDEEESYEEELEESISFDEHLLERISVLEESLKRTADTLRQILSMVHKQERSILINQSGLTALHELLENRGVVGGEEWSRLWESKMDYQLLVLDKREQFLALKERIAGLFEGERRSTFESLLHEAEKYLNQFDLDSALAILESAFGIDKRNYELAAFLGETWFNEGDLERALPYFERVLAVQPDHFEGLVYGGALYHERGRSDRAEELLSRAVSLYPDSFLALFGLGAVCAAGGNLEKASMLLERAVRIDPVPQALYLLGSCQYEMGKTTRAIRSLEQATRHDPGLEEAHYLLGLARLDRGWNRRALDAFRQAQRLNPKRLQYGDLVRFLEDPESRPPQIPREAGEWLTRGEDALARGDIREALSAYQEALSHAPEHPTVLLSYALLCLQLNRDQEIEPLTRRVLASQPGETLEATAYAALIEALRGQGRYRESNRVGRILLSEGRSDFSKTIAYYEMAFNLAEMEEDLDEALSYAQQSLEAAPDRLQAFPLAALGWVHYQRGELDQAVDCLSRSSELGSSTTTLTHLGMALLAAGEQDRARAVLADARRLRAPGEALGERMMEVMKESYRR